MRFMDYWDGEVNLIEKWYEIQDDSVKAAFDVTLKEILGTRDLGTSTQLVRCVRQHLGLWEVRFEVIQDRRKRHFRPVGFWNYGGEEFVLVNGCEKSGRVTIPAGIFDNALDIHCQFFNEGRGTINEHDI